MGSFIPDRVQRSEYLRNILKLGSGTALSGLMPVLASPVLMKLYEPDQYGVLALFISSYFILSVISTGRYEHAIVLPRKDDDARYLMLASISLSFLVCLFSAIVLFFGHGLIETLFQIEELGVLIYLIPITAFLFATGQNFFYYANRYKRYGLMAKAKLTNNGMQVGSQILFGFVPIVFNGLVVGQLLGRFAGLLNYIGVLRTSFDAQFKFSLARMRAIAIEYIHFPKHLSLSYGIAAFYQQLPIFFVSGFYSPSTAGNLAIAIQLVAVPNGLIANAIGDVFRQRAVEDYHKTGSFRTVLLKTLKGTALAGIVPFALIIWLAPIVLEWYDAAWADAGVYAAILAVALFFSFVVTPIDKALIVVEKTNWLLYWHAGFFAGHLLAIAFAVFSELSTEIYLALLVGVRIAAYLAMAILSYYVSGKNQVSKPSV